MADTHGFEVVLEASEALITKELRGAWKSAECPVDPGEQGRIPEFMDIPEDTNLGGYLVNDGQIQIPQNELEATMAPDVNGIQLKLGLNLQVEIKDPPVPSAGFFDMTADVRAKAPVGTLAGGLDVGILLDGLPLGNVSATLTSGDPLAPKLDTLMAEYVHKIYENWTPTGPIDPTFPVIPHVVDETNVSFGPGGDADAHTELYDDDSDLAHQILITRPSATSIQISIPVYLRIFDIHVPIITLQDPMGIETRMNILAILDSPPGSYTTRLSTATVTVAPIQPASASITGSTLEGNNYTANKATLAGLPFVSINLDDLLTQQLRTRGETMAHNMGDFTINVPTVGQIEDAIKEIFHTELESRDFMSIWTPSSSANIEVTDVTPKALSDVLAIALNAGGGADANALTNFIPADREFAIAIGAAKLNQIISDTRDDQGLSDSQLPKRFVEDGEDVDLNTLNVFLVDGAIRLTGSVTVIDAIAGSIDVDADFRSDIGLHWEPNAALDAAGTQMLKHHNIGDPDVDPEESVLFWVLAVIFAIITGGLGVIVLVIVVLIVENIVKSLGSEMVTDTTTGALSGITAWPPNLTRIGRVRALFHDPVLIDTTGVVLAGTAEVISSCEIVAVVAASSGSSYTIPAASAVTLTAANVHPAANYRWIAGDGSAQVNLQNEVHTYAASGLYIAKHALTITQPGGATSRHFALVNVRNVPPTVDAGADITVNEGEVVTLVGRFWDVEYPDTHESTWNFGDDQSPLAGTISETNSPPMAVGTSTVQHAWCDNGTYTVALQVRDQNGGITTDTRIVTVLNVPPKVDAGADMFAYPCTVITLTGKFEDPGWCDTHVGFWDFGDCSPTQTAVVRETNEPPAAKGDVIASHKFEHCGTYHAVCTVIDDDGAQGQDAVVIRVIDVENADFERGYRERLLGTVANYWEPYVAPALNDPQSLPSTGAAVPAGDVFFCEECLVHGGQGSQRIKFEQLARSGICQLVGANPGWDYQISAWYVINERTLGTARLGIDPDGGDDPSAPGIVWMAGTERKHWAQLTVRATATGRAITIFVEAGNDKHGPLDVCFDDVALAAVQPFCPEQEDEEEKPPEREDLCVDFTDERANTGLKLPFEKKKFNFDSQQSGQVAHIVAFGDPVGQSKLQVPALGLIVRLPFTSDRARVKACHQGGKPLQITALNNAGQVAGQASLATTNNVLQTVEVAAPSMVVLIFEARGSESLLFEICARRDPRKEQERDPETKIVGPIRLTNDFDLKAGLAQTRSRVERNISARKKAGKEK